MPVKTKRLEDGTIIRVHFDGRRKKKKGKVQRKHVPPKAVRPSRAGTRVTRSVRTGYKKKGYG